MDEQEALYKKIKNFPLFAGLNQSQGIFLLEYLHSRLERFEKGCLISPLSGTIRSFALILLGALELSQYDYWGNRSIILTLETGASVGLASALFEDWVPPADIFARTGCELLFFDAQKLRTPESFTIPACALLKSNIAKQLAIKNAALVNKISLINRRTTREKIALFLSRKAAQCHSNRFKIEFSRQEMADFLSVNRCALSKELARMQSDGLITYNGAYFELKDLKGQDHHMVNL